MKAHEILLKPRGSRQAFTIVELFAVLVVLALIAVTRFPALSHTRNRSQDAVDFYNNKQLMAAANMYAADHNDVLPGCGWGNANDSWAYAKNISGNYAAQLDYLRRGQLFPYVKNEAVFMCPLDKPTGLFFLRGLLVTSYTWNGAVSSFGSLTTDNGQGSYRLAQFLPNSIIQWEADASSPFYFNDAASYPDEGVSDRHGSAATTGLISGGIQRIQLSQWFSSRYAGQMGARGTSIPTNQLPNQIWCNPGNRLGRM